MNEDFLDRLADHRGLRNIQATVPPEDLEDGGFCYVEFDEDGYVGWTWPELNENND